MSYEPRKIPAVLTVDWINKELEAIATEHNSHVFQDFPDNCIPLYAMQNRYGAWVGTVQSGTDLTGSTSLSLYYPIPVACTMIGYATCCFLKVGSGATTYRVEYTATRSPVSWADLVAPTAMSTALYNYHGSCTLSLVPGDCVRVTYAVPAGDTLYRPTATLRFKAKHTI